MKIKLLVLSCACVALFSGCWTLSETEYPETKIDRVPAGKKVSVYFDGFDAPAQEYVPVDGHEQMLLPSTDDCVDGPWVKGSANTNVAYTADKSVARTLIDRACVAFERRGYDIRVLNPDYLVEVRLSGPVYPERDVLRQLGWMVCTLFTAENVKVTWTAKLRVYDRKHDGKYAKSAFEKEYVQEYELTEWGPIPVASPGCSHKVPPSAFNSWAMTALADAACTDAAAFIAGRIK